MTQIKTLSDEQIVISDLNLKGDFVDIAINKHLFLHIVRSDCGYFIDSYKYATQEELSSDDYDFDSDYIDSLTIRDEKLNKQTTKGAQNGI